MNVKVGICQIKISKNKEENYKTVIDAIISLAKKGKVRPEDVHKELNDWGLFEEYQDQFFSIMK